MRAGFGLVVAAGVAAVALDLGVAFTSTAESAPRPAAAASCPSARSHDPYAVAQRFILAAVERKDMRKAYALTTPSLRHNASCGDWVRGRVPLPRMAHIDWQRSGYKPVAGGSNQLVLRIFLAAPNAALPASFLMELRQQSDGNWRVGAFQRDQTAPQNAALAA